MKTTFSFVPVLLAAAFAVVGCSSANTSSAKKPASGAPKAVTKTAPTKTAVPAKKGAPNVVTHTDQATADEQVPCDPNEEGLAACVDNYVVFCANGKAWALDCSVAYEHATCGEIDDTIDCIVAEE